jgi:hypothetical protein
VPPQVDVKEVRRLTGLIAQSYDARPCSASHPLQARAM